MALNERLYLEQRRTDYHGRIGCSIYPADMGRYVLGSEVVWIMLTRRHRRGIRPNKPTKEEAIAAGWRMVLGAINDSMIISVAALHDEFGFGEERAKRFLERYSLIFESCIQEGDMLDVGSIEKVLKEEGIKCVEYHKYDFMRIEKGR